MTPEIVIWSAAAAFLLLAWPLSRRMKHPDMKPLAAWLVFVSVFALAGGALFAALAGAISLVGATGALDRPAWAILAALLVIAPALAAARASVRRPPRGDGPPP